MAAKLLLVDGEPALSVAYDQRTNAQAVVDAVVKSLTELNDPLYPPPIEVRYSD
jgi:hypothetical protein